MSAWSQFIFTSNTCVIIGYYTVDCAIPKYIWTSAQMTTILDEPMCCKECDIYIYKTWLDWRNFRFEMERIWNKKKTTWQRGSDISDSADHRRKMASS